MNINLVGKANSISLMNTEFKEGPISDIPAETLVHILSFLNNSEVAVFARTSKFHNSVSLLTIKDRINNIYIQNIQIIQLFIQIIQSLINELSKMKVIINEEKFRIDSTIEKLLSINKVAPLNCTDWSQLKSCSVTAISIRVTIVTALDILFDEQLELLKTGMNQYKIQEFDNILQILSIFQKARVQSLSLDDTQIVKKFPSELLLLVNYLENKEKCNFIKHILTQIKSLDDKIIDEFFEKLSSTQENDSFRFRNCTLLMLENRVDLALRQLTKLSDEKVLISTKVELSDMFVIPGQINKALEFINSIPEKAIYFKKQGSWHEDKWIVNSECKNMGLARDNAFSRCLLEALNRETGDVFIEIYKLFPSGAIKNQCERDILHVLEQWKNTFGLKDFDLTGESMIELFNRKDIYSKHTFIRSLKNILFSRW